MRLETDKKLTREGAIYSVVNSPFMQPVLAELGHSQIQNRPLVGFVAI